MWISRLQRACKRLWISEKAVSANTPSTHQGVAKAYLTRARLGAIASRDAHRL
jgi:hypothetical protein